MNKELLEKVMELSKKDITLEKLVKELDLSELEILGLINELQKQGVNITKFASDDGIHFLNKGDITNKLDNQYTINIVDDEFKFAVISDTRLGSNAQQLSILNDIYKKAESMGIKHILHCGNISEGIYPINNQYADSVFKNDTNMQAMYIIDNYPYIEGINTYFLCGSKDQTHLKKNKADIGKIITSNREDMIYLGNDRCLLNIKNSVIDMRNVKAKKTYTVSYRGQKMVDAMRSEDVPDILLYGGLLQMESFNYRGVRLISAPSCCASTNEMINNEYNNIVGNWFVTVKFDSKGNITSIIPISSTYYKTNKDDYLKAKTLKKGGF